MKIIEPPPFNEPAEVALWWHISKRPEEAAQILGAIPHEALSPHGQRPLSIWMADSPASDKRRLFLGQYRDIMSQPPAMTMEHAISQVMSAYHRRQVWQSSIDVLTQVCSQLPDDGKITAAIAKAAQHHAADRQSIAGLTDEITALIEYWGQAAAGQITRVPLGLGLDRFRLTGPGKLVIVGARPGNCKTTFALNAMLTQLVAGYGVAFHCREMSSIEVINRIVSIRADLPFAWLDMGRVDNRAPEACAWLGKQNLRLACGKCLPHIGHVEQWIRESVRRHGVSVAWLDYLTLIKHDQVKGRQDRRLEVADITRRLKDLAQELQIPIIALAQVNRQGDDVIPSVAQLKEAGDIEQDADSIILLDLPKDGNRKYVVMTDAGLHEMTDTELKSHLVMAVRKNRNGPGGIEAAYFMAETMSLTQPRLGI
jgi:replicative DNA helicase